MSFRKKPTHWDPYATVDDFRQLFTENLEGLYHLAFLLARDPDTAEQCFVAPIEDCVASNRVFRDRALAWAERAVVRNAIWFMRPYPENAAQRAGDITKRAPAPYLGGLRSVFALGLFERFVYVMLILEGYSDRDSGLHLGCSVAEVGKARNRALAQLVATTHTDSRKQISRIQMT